MKNKRSNFSEDELWLAFQYVAGELSTVEAEVFEQQLRDCVSLCEAVVEATLLTSAVAGSQQYEARPAVATAVSRQTNRGHSGIAALVAVCCCIFAVFIATQFSDTAAVVAVESTEAERLVDAWADTFSTDNHQEVYNTDFQQQELDVPDWLMAAVSLAESNDQTGNSLDGRGDGAEWF